MTLLKLHKIISKAIEMGHGRKPVCVDKSTFQHALESDGAVILHAKSAFLQWVPTLDDDGGTKWNKDGTEAGKSCFVIEGDSPNEP